MADNEFIIDTTLDTKDAENNAESLNKRIKNMTKDIEKMSDKQKLAFQKSADSFNKSARAVENQKAKLQGLINKMEQMKDVQVPTEQYSAIEKQIEQSQLKLNKLVEAQELFLANGGKTKSRTYKTREDEIEQLTKTIEYAKAEQKELLDSGGAYQPIDTTKMEQQIDNAKAKLSEMESDLNNKGLDLNLKLDGIQSPKLTALKLISMELRGIQTLAKGTANVIKKSFITAFNVVKKVSSIALNGIKTGFSKISSAIKNPKALSKPFDVGFKKIMKYGLGVRSLFALVNKLRNALGEGLKNLANFNNGANSVNKDLTLLKSSLTQLKNSFATAFAPIISMVVPVIAKLSAMLSELVTKIGMVIAKLGGATAFTKAKKVVDQYADAVGGANKQLGAFDELNNTNSDSGGGGLSPNDMFETVDIDSDITNMADKLKTAWENADFENIGNDIGKKILDGLKNIPWNRIKSYASQVGKSLATLLNGVFKTDGLGFELGNTLAQGFNTALSFVNSFLKNFNFSSFGKFIGDGINGLLLNIDWNMLGENFSLKVNGIFSTIGNAVKTIKWSEIASKIASGINTAITSIDAKKIGETIGETFKGSFKFLSKAIQDIKWYELGKKIDECIRSVDWNGVADGLFETLGSAIGGLGAFLWGIIETAMDDIATWWYDKAFENGSFSIMGLLNGILEIFKDIGTWIYEHVFKPFWDGICKAFDINSPSKVMMEIGKFIVQGLFDGIESLIGDVVQLWEDFKETVLGVFDALWDGLKKIINSILGGIESMANGVVQGINKVIDVLNNLHVEIPDWVPKFGGKTIGFHIGHMNEVSLPRLASGTVVPRQSSEFMAIMGDNNKETEVVSPLSTMVEAFNTALNNREDTELLRAILQAIYDKETGITESQLFNSVRKSARMYTRTTGDYAF